MRFLKITQVLQRFFATFIKHIFFVCCPHIIDAN